MVVARTSQRSRVARIVTADRDLPRAATGEAVTLVLDDDLDVARGDVLADPARPPEVAHQLSAHLVWLGDEPMLPGRTYLVKLGTRTVPCTITSLRHRIDVESGEARAARTLECNEIGRCTLDASDPVAVDPYRQNRDMGGFIVIDRYTAATVGAGMVEFALRRDRNLHRQPLAVGKAERSALKGQKGAIVWFTGLSGSGKSTIANLVERKLADLRRHTYLIDGDNVRHGLNRDLGFTAEARVENVRRVGEVARLFVDAGLIALCSFISPYRAERRMVRELVDPGEFFEVYVATPIDVCRNRDPKGLYRKADAGEIPNFTGVDAPYEVPEQADLVLDATSEPADVLADRVVSLLRERGIVGG